jgi:hypothetical protein
MWVSDNSYFANGVEWEFNARNESFEGPCWS